MLTDEEKQEFLDALKANRVAASQEAQPAIQRRARELIEEGLETLRSQDPAEGDKRLGESLAQMKSDPATSWLFTRTGEPAGPDRPQTSLPQSTTAKGLQVRKGSLLVSFARRVKHRVCALGGR